MAWIQTLSVIASLAAVTGMQTFWVARALDRVDARFDRVDARFDRIDDRLDRIDGRLADQGERLARLEGTEPPSLRRA